VAVEPAGAAALAAVARHERFRAKNVAVVASGGNVDVSLLQHALSGGSAETWRAAQQ
jgi:threonine dehydratase